MKGVRKIGRGLLIAAAASFVAVAQSSCGVENDITAEQIKNIESYLTKQEAEYTIQSGAYKQLIANSATEPSDVYAQKGDVVEFKFAAYTFNTAPSGLYYTNWEHLVAGEADLNTKYWSFEPVKVKIGDGSIIKGVENALPNCQVGDSVAVYLNSDLCYGDVTCGLVPESSAVMFLLSIESINKL